MPKAARVKTGCQSCREKRVKCDTAAGNCSRCSRRGVPCVRASEFHNHDEDKFSPSQTWITPPLNLTFVNENPEVRDDYYIEASESTKVHTSGNDSTVNNVASSSHRPTRLSSSTNDFSISLTNSCTPALSAHAWTGDGDDANTVAYEANPGFAIVEQQAALPSRETPLADRNEPNDLPPALRNLYTPRQTTCINTQEQVHLFRHFREAVARNLDITDPACHFANEAPLRAQDSPVLAYALMAASARHLSQTSSFSALIADHYHQKCLELLIPFLNSATAVLSETLLSTIVILRYLEEIDASMAINTWHRIGTRAFINLQTHNSRTRDLRSAAFWLGVRQEVYYAIANQKPTLLHFTPDECDEKLDGTTDGAWANRMVMHCVRVVNFCFGALQSAAEHASLRRYCDAWIAALPSSYTPLVFRDTGPWPQVVYLERACVVGLQHHHLASMLLCAHDPEIPRVGLARISASETVNDELKVHARMVCGLAVGNDEIGPAFVNASMAILLAGALFHEAKERKACFDILEKCQGRGWPTEEIQKQLRLSWGEVL